MNTASQTGTVGFQMKMAVARPYTQPSKICNMNNINSLIPKFATVSVDST